MIYVVLPAFNEARAIGPTVTALATMARGREDRFHIVLVDDGSSDDTTSVARAALDACQCPIGFTTLRHEVNQGLGAALRTGLYWCVQEAADDDVVVTLDADNTHPAAMIPHLVGRLDQGFDLCIASRYRPGAAVRGVPLYRRVLSDAGRLVFQALYPIPGVRDYTCCFRAYRIGVLRRARAVYGDDLCTARGFEAVMDLLLRLGALDLHASELGFVLDYGPRVGQSKMKVLRTIRSTTALLLRRRWQRMTRQRTPAAKLALHPERQ
ncbi:MAG TPA: glycosyltransferase family 2 protein [Gemmatimonadales bacterium]|nr:glycosyltransferase family 2 protein [Gemmatimonadales bacterium]